MRAKDIILGEYYRLSSSPNYGWVKPIQILKPKESENTNNYIIVKCEHSVDKNDTFGIIRCFKPVNIIRG